MLFECKENLKPARSTLPPRWEGQQNEGLQRSQSIRDGEGRNNGECWDDTAVVCGGIRFQKMQHGKVEMFF